tara:strand:- start:77 stop:460 length:384 start_codon:yes stop_codon:yes gene_type:complete
MLAPLQKFTKLWPVSLNESFKRDFKKAGYNPERYLGLQKKKGAFNTIDQWVRYKDYQILYKPARSTDPQWVKRLQDEDIVDAFLTPEHKITDTDVAEIECLIRDQKKNQDLYARPFWKKVLTKLWQH